MEKTFVQGLIFKPKHEKAPDFIKGKLSIKVDELKQFLDEHNDNGWINVILKENKDGKYYAELDTWKPEKKEQAEQTQLDQNDEYTPDNVVKDIPF